VKISGKVNDNVSKNVITHEMKLGLKDMTKQNDNHSYGRVLILTCPQKA
jgi:hypothetical protein